VYTERLVVVVVIIIIIVILCFFLIFFPVGGMGGGSSATSYPFLIHGKQNEVLSSHIIFDSSSFTVDLIG